jgi:hypothetical protein
MEKLGTLSVADSTGTLSIVAVATIDMSSFSGF